MLSANQINAQIKLVEMWKSTNDPGYPIQCDKLEASEGARMTRAITRGDLKVKGASLKCQSTFINDASRAWNKAPEIIKNCKTLFSASPYSPYSVELEDLETVSNEYSVVLNTE